MEHEKKDMLKINNDSSSDVKVRAGADGALNGFAGVHKSFCTTRHGNTKLLSFYAASSYFGFVPVEKVFGDEAPPDFAKANPA